MKQEKQNESVFEDDMEKKNRAAFKRSRDIFGFDEEKNRAAWKRLEKKSEISNWVQGFSWGTLFGIIFMTIMFAILRLGL